MADPTEPAYSPSVDGYVLPPDPASRFASGLQNDVPLLRGQNADEGTIFSAIAGVPADTKEHFIAAATSAFGTNSINTFLQFYPANGCSGSGSIVSCIGSRIRCLRYRRRRNQ
ncbi:hypothetical protein [Paraburkholderia sp.]|uniref:hypothetical protein n=1 Tax=Paraburkholderia sp. TaxID=1926495 RepID=UPI002D4CD2E2|nr:hypothetical protein [Paraburkholderia sp.]HZZ04700.1 hypothetical protein [Paraburkholderia sp.]